VIYLYFERLQDWLNKDKPQPKMEPRAGQPRSA